MTVLKNLSPHSIITPKMKVFMKGPMNGLPATKLISLLLFLVIPNHSVVKKD